MAEEKLEFDPRICELTQRNINQRITDVEKRLIQAIDQASVVMKMSDEGRSKTLEEAIKTIQSKFEEIKNDLKLQGEKCASGEEDICKRSRQMIDACKSAEILKFEHLESEIEHLRQHIDTCATEVKEKEIKKLTDRVDNLETKRIKPLEDKCDDIDKLLNKYKYIIIGAIIASIPIGNTVWAWILKLM